MPGKQREVSTMAVVVVYQHPSHVKGAGFSGPLVTKHYTTHSFCAAGFAASLARRGATNIEIVPVSVRVPVALRVAAHKLHFPNHNCEANGCLARLARG